MTLVVIIAVFGCFAIALKFIDKFWND